MPRDTVNQRVEQKVDTLDRKIDELLVQAKVTNGRVNRAEKDISELKSDNCNLWTKYNLHENKTARHEGAMQEWEKHMNEFRVNIEKITKDNTKDFDKRIKKIESAITQRGLLTTVGSGGSSLVAILLLRVLGLI